MPHHLIRKLEQFTRLSSEEKQELHIAAQKRRQLGAHEDIIREGDDPSHVNLILSGWACRYKTLEDGRRQIISFLVPGDLCDDHVYILRAMDHTIGTLTAVTYAEISRDTLMGLTGRYPRLTQALWWQNLVSSAIQREWTVNLGQRSASERLGHLLCELFVRLRGVGHTSDNTCQLPITQLDLADAMGLSTVHVNRTLQDLRAAGLIVLKGRQLTILNVEALARASLFNANYLHLDRVGQHLDANEH